MPAMLRTRLPIPVLLVALAAAALPASPAAAAPPAAPVLVSPASGSTAAGPTPTLSVTATDPDGDALDVRFEGRRLGATVPGGGGAGDPFTLVVLPDTQNYTYAGRQGTIVQQAQWAVDTRASLNTVFVAQLGDLVSNFDNTTQWGHVSNGLAVLDAAGVPNSVVPGNHDFDNVGQGVGLYDTYFPVSRYRDASWNTATTRYGGYLGQSQFGADPVDRRNMDNYNLFSAGGRDFILLNLEWEAPGYALDWADQVLDAYPDRIAIVATHSFVTVTGTRLATAERPGGTPAAVMWNDFVRTHCSIKLVVSGHEHDGDAGEARRTDPNACGEPVQQILTDYQSRANGGDGWLRYYTFDPAANTMRATTYSPKLGVYETDADSAFTVPFDLGDPQPAPFTTIATAATVSGGTATTPWTGLQPDTVYEWRAVASDGATSATSPTWTVRTPPVGSTVDDTFTRTIAGGWGNADTGQSWASVGAATSLSVDGTRGRVAVPIGSTRGGRLPSVALGDTAITTDLAIAEAATGSGSYLSVNARIASTRMYRATLRAVAGGSATLTLVRLDGAETKLVALTVPGLRLTAGLPVRLRFEATGSSPTTLRAKAWAIGTTEPAGWTVTTTDATAALQGPGGVGLELYQSSSSTTAATLLVDRFTATGSGTPPPNTPPTAAIGTPGVTERTVTLSGTGSTDPDGTIAAYAWDLGDGTTATGPTTTRTYAADGTYTVRLTVTDDDGATGTTTRTVTVATTPPPNTPPTAAIGTPGVTGRTITLSGTGSTDPDGTIAAYAWDLGDGTTATGPTTTRTYAADGTYTVRLTVTDDDGATGTTTRTVTVTTPPAGALVQDAFGRTVASGWGAADAGGAWSISGAASRYSVSGGVGRQSLDTAGITTAATLPAPASTAVDLRVSISSSATPSAGTQYWQLLPRLRSATDDYQVGITTQSTGRPDLIITRKVGGTTTTLARVTVPTVTVTAGGWMDVAVRLTPSGGATVIAAKLWTRGTAEPSAWQATATDASPSLQGTGSISLRGYRSSSSTTASTLSFDDLRVVAP